MKKTKAIKELLDEALANANKLCNDMTGVTNEGIWKLNHDIHKTPELTEDVKKQVLYHLNLYINSWVTPYIEEAMEILEK